MTGLAPDRLRSWLRLLLAMHDLGKASLRFQSLSPAVCQQLQGKTTQKPYSIRHDALTQALWDHQIFNTASDVGLFHLADGDRRAAR